MKKYIGTKLISAVAMGLVQAQELLKRDVGYQGLVDEEGDAPGYLVSYNHGKDNEATPYQSWSPTDIFEEAYHPIDNMTFGLAIEALKKGFKVSRAKWDGRGMWVVLVGLGYFDVGCSKVGYNPRDPKNTPKLVPWIGMKTEDNKFVPWQASQTDVLAEDWVIVE